MTFASVLVPLYAASGIAAAAFYLPQLRLLWTSAEARRSLSLVSWGGWLAIAVIGLAYTIVVVGDAVMALVSGLNLLCQAAVFALAAAPRLRRAWQSGNTRA